MTKVKHVSSNNISYNQKNGAPQPFVFVMTATRHRIGGPHVALGPIGAHVSHPIYKNINRAIIYAPGSSHAYIQQNHQDITTCISK
jgi:hypothetical protein